MYDCLNTPQSSLCTDSEVLAGLVIQKKNFISCDTTPCRPLKANGRFEACYLIFLGIFFWHEYVSDMFLRNVV
jgi:hypothetical protein